MLPRPAALIVWLLLAAIAAASSPCLARVADSGIPEQRPLLTTLPWSLARGELELAAGLLHRDDVAFPFFAERAGTRRAEWRAALVDTTLGLGGGGEVQLRFGVQRFHEEGGLRQTGIEDARVAFTYQLPVERLASALRFEVKLPNAPDTRRLGTDQADIFMGGAVGGRGLRWGWAGNLGLGILGDPRQPAVQDDLLTFGAACWYAARRGPAMVLLGEVNGAAASRFGNDMRIARVGLRWGERLKVDLSVRRGLTGPSEDWGIEAGLTLRPRPMAP